MWAGEGLWSREERDACICQVATTFSLHWSRPDCLGPFWPIYLLVRRQKAAAFPIKCQEAVICASTNIITRWLPEWRRLASPLHSGRSESSRSLLTYWETRQRFTRHPTTLHNGPQQKRNEEAVGHYCVLHCWEETRWLAFYQNLVPGYFVYWPPSLCSSSVCRMAIRGCRQVALHSHSQPTRQDSGGLRPDQPKTLLVFVILAMNKKFNMKKKNDPVVWTMTGKPTVHVFSLYPMSHMSLPQCSRVAPVCPSSQLVRKPHEDLSII